jgi:alkylation response protein AidB-like acyl-CoA dehydrogenase
VNGGGRAEPLAGADILDDRMRALDRYCWDLAAEFRAAGLALDRDPDAVADLAGLCGVRLFQQTFTPTGYRPRLDVPPGLPDDVRSVLGATVLAERLAYGDPGVVLAGPGPSLSGSVVAALAGGDQLARFFGRLDDGRTYTFFALTEPGKGSAATELETTLTAAADGDGWILHGEKSYIGNGTRAQLGVVFCRRTPGPWGIEAVVVDATDPGVSVTPMSTLGLRGAAVSHLRFDQVRVPRDNLLGADRPASRRGLHGAMSVLYRARPGIAAFALGCAQATCDYLRGQRRDLTGTERSEVDGLLDRIAATRYALYRVAADIDRGSVNAHRVGGVKATAALLAEEVTLVAADLLGPAALIEHPWLEKTYRDVRSFEVMEGTTNLHRLSVFQGLLKDSFFR